MNKKELKEEIKVEDMIYEIRGKQVMLDSDLAKLYRCKNGTKEINQAVKNNPDKFPERFSFILDDVEVKTFAVKIFDLKNNGRGGRRNVLRFFTEQGVAMLATILKTPVATQTSIQIMDAFVEMRKYINNNILNQYYINKLVIEDHDRINLLEQSFDKLEEKTKTNSLFFEG